MTHPETQTYRHPIAIFVYGVIAYLAFFGTILYAIGFVGGIIVPKTLDTGTPGSAATAVVVNALLLLLFAVQHTIMARPAFKAWWTTIIPKAAERSTFVLIASGILMLTFWQWRPMPQTVWQIEAPAARAVLHGLFALGWGLVFYSSFCIDHFDLFGLRQVFLHLRRQPYTHPGFARPILYRLVRNPLMLGFVIAMWSTPDMSIGHLLFAMLTTGYIFFGVHMEERDLLKHLGDDYRQYREQTPMLFPWPRPRRPVDATTASVA